jgi:hypothetical protein
MQWAKLGLVEATINGEKKTKKKQQKKHWDLTSNPGA